MNPIKALGYRSFQAVFHIAMPLLPYREPKRLKSNEALAQILQEQHKHSVLLVTDGGIAKLGLHLPMVDALETAHIAVAVYDKTVPNPTIANIEDATQLYYANGCEAIIGFGGGSAMDCAKGVAVHVGKPKADLRRLGGILKVHTKLPLLIAVPTTAGTGSEVTLAAVVTDEKTHHKFAINDFPLIPDYAIHDYKVTVGLPKHITAQTGMDALVHAVESYIGRSTTAYTRKKSEDAVILIHDYLLRAYEDGTDAEARCAMQLASYDAGIAFTMSYVGYVHALAHSLGGQYGVPHGLANAVILPHFLRAYGSAIHLKLARLARIAGLVGPRESHEQAAHAFIDWVDGLNEKMGIPKYLDGIKPADIPQLAKYADAEANPLYPVPVLMTRKQLEHMYYVVGGMEHTERPHHGLH